GDSFGKVHSLLKELDGLNPAKVHEQTVRVLQNTMNAKEASLFIVSENRQYVRLITSTGPFNRTDSLLKVADHSFLQHV
ncbi:hypothetical protein, partial [Escherichia coli]|uniref:hypothetical protein n=1 Tax=Escherichia coli TaxID=562 RepID=UPI001CCCA368